MRGPTHGCHVCFIHNVGRNFNQHDLSTNFSAGVSFLLLVGRIGYEAKNAIGNSIFLWETLNSRSDMSTLSSSNAILLLIGLVGIDALATFPNSDLS